MSEFFERARAAAHTADDEVRLERLREMHGWHTPPASGLPASQWRFRAEGEPLSEDQLLMRKRVLHQAEAEPESFSMDFWEDSDGCGTTRCIAGWAVFFARQDGMSGIVPASVAWAGITVLGLTRREYNGSGSQLSLFYEEDAPALERLRKLAGE